MACRPQPEPARALVSILPVATGAFDFNESATAPPEVAELLDKHESLPWRRRRFEQVGSLLGTAPSLMVVCAHRAHTEFVSLFRPSAAICAHTSIAPTLHRFIIR